MPDDNGRSAAWGVVAVVFGAGAVGTWIAALTVPTAFVRWTAVASALSLITAISICLTFASVYGWPTISMKTVYGLRRDPPLILTLEDQDWELWQDYAWIAALKIRITNTTNRVMRLSQFSLMSDLSPGNTRKLQDQKPVSALSNELSDRRNSHDPLLKLVTLQPADSTSGWYVDTKPVPIQGGRPLCWFVLTDAVGDTYELVIPARPQKTYRMPTHESNS